MRSVQSRGALWSPSDLSLGFGTVRRAPSDDLKPQDGSHAVSISIMSLGARPWQVINKTNSKSKKEPMEGSQNQGNLILWVKAGEKPRCCNRFNQMEVGEWHLVYAKKGGAVEKMSIWISLSCSRKRQQWFNSGDLEETWLSFGQCSASFIKVDNRPRIVSVMFGGSWRKCVATQQLTSLRPSKHQLQ